jgi:hypothetical protein
MPVTHVKSNTIADATGTVTFWDGATTASAAATNLVRPSDWNSNHNLLYNMTGNTLGSSSVSGTDIYFGVTGPGLSVSASTAAAAPATMWFKAADFISQWSNNALVASQTQGITNSGSVSTAFAVNVAEPLSVSFLRIPALMTTNSTTIQTTANITIRGDIYSTWNAVLYSYGTGASSKSLLSVASGSAGFTFMNSCQVGAASNNQSVTQAFSHALEGVNTNTSTSYTVNAGGMAFSTTFWTAFTSNRFIDINFANTVAPGQYVMMIGHSTNTAVTTNAAAASVITNGNVRYSNHYGNSQANLSIGPMGATAVSTGMPLGQGSFSTAGGGTTSAFALSNITTSASHVVPAIQMLRFA